MILTRRTFLKNTAALTAAPGIVKASNIMSVRPHSVWIPSGTYQANDVVYSGMYLGTYSERDYLPNNDQPIIAGDWAHIVDDRRMYMFNGKTWQPVMKL